MSCGDGGWEDSRRRSGPPRDNYPSQAGGPPRGEAPTAHGLRCAAGPWSSHGGCAVLLALGPAIAAGPWSNHGGYVLLLALGPVPPAFDRRLGFRHGPGISSWEINPSIFHPSPRSQVLGLARCGALGLLGLGRSV